MKKILAFSCFLLPVLVTAQQNLPVSFFKYEKKIVLDTAAYLKELNSIRKKDSTEYTTESFLKKEDELEKKLKLKYTKAKSAKNDSLHFRLYGIGNLSDETLKSLNGGGKLAVSFIPNPKSDKMHAYYFASFNKNASNTDSAISTMLVFPEAGNHTALLSVIWQKEKEVEDEPGLVYSYGPFFEFAFKKITNKKDTADPKFQELAINTLHYTTGLKFGYSKLKSIEGKLYQLGCGLSVFASYVNIPDEDHTNFEKITNLKATNNSFFMIGAKASFEINGFQIFADIRHVFGDANKLPIKDLKGFNSNIGVAFNTEIFRF